MLAQPSSTRNQVKCRLQVGSCQSSGAKGSSLSRNSYGHEMRSNAYQAGVPSEMTLQQARLLKQGSTENLALCHQSTAGKYEKPPVPKLSIQVSQRISTARGEEKRPSKAYQSNVYLN